MSIAQINYREKKRYILDRANRNIKIFDNQFSFLNLVGNANKDKYKGANRDNLDKYSAEALIEPNGFYFNGSNISIIDYKGYIKTFSKVGEFLDYKKLDKVSYSLPAAQELNNKVLVAHPEKKEIYTYIGNELYPLEQLNRTINNNSSFDLHEITSFCSDGYDYYITFFFRDYKIAIISKDKFQLKKILSLRAKPNKIWINKPTRLNIKNGSLFVQEDNSVVKRIECSPKPTREKQTNIKGGNFDFISNDKILLAVRNDNKILLCDTTGKLIDTWNRGIDFSLPYFVKNMKSSTIIIDRFNKYSRIYHFSNDGKLIKQITKNDYNKNFNSYSAVIDDDNNIYISENGSVHVYDDSGKYVKTLGGFATHIRQDLNLGLGVTKTGKDLKLNLGDYKPQPLHFETILRTEIYKKHLFIADYYKVVITDLQGNIKGYIGGDKGTKVGEFDMIHDFCIWNDRIFIADNENNRIVVYKISL